MLIKHFEWSEVVGNSYNQGRIAVSCEQRLEVRQIAGKAPPAAVLPQVVAALGQEAVDAMVAEHYGRQNRYAVEVRDGMSGSRDYLLREERDARLKDHPIRGGIHISMYGKLNESVDIWAGDVPPIMIEMYNQNEFLDSAEIEVEEVEVRDFDFQRPDLTLSIFESGQLGIDRPQEEPLETGEEYDDTGEYLSEETLERLRQISFGEEKDA